MSKIAGKNQQLAVYGNSRLSLFLNVMAAKCIPDVMHTRPKLFPSIWDANIPQNAPKKLPNSRFGVRGTLLCVKEWDRISSTFMDGLGILSAFFC